MESQTEKRIGINKIPRRTEEERELDLPELPEVESPAGEKDGGDAGTDATEKGSSAGGARKVPTAENVKRPRASWD